jgi:hypothetical protein
MFTYEIYFISAGTRIVYERAFLMQLRNSPVARTPPKNYPNFPASLMKGVDVSKENTNIIPSPTKKGEGYIICNEECIFIVFGDWEWYS